MTEDGDRTEHPVDPAEGDREAGEQAEERVRRQQEAQRPEPDNDQEGDQAAESPP